ncbi:hypothetical protein PsYK624_115770 [Phanerochaete sordida]|uniref:Uncharacterized protein n=1 Tax=Phanerochaete sordida TaxID=48140 RepID=A0A9P3GI79_9APHY|nr:hypothetical protein PsYK624_115770 [Phanerochaete sordida]
MADAALPELLDPALDFLADRLPGPLFDLLEALLTHAYSLAAAAWTLARTLAGRAGLSLDAEKLLPPLLTLLAAYLALVSFYRTTGWMLRTAFAFAKWGFILSTLGGLAGYLLANAGPDGAGALAQLGGGLGGVLLGLFAPDQNARQNTRGGAGGRARSSQRGAGKDRPKAWDAWDKHRDWQYKEQEYHQGGDADGANVQQVIGNIIGSAGKAIKDSGIWDKAKEAVEELSKGGQADGETGSSRRRKNRGTKSR